ncbi:(5-formylfuran-3-yl)methyl phosphate synthase [Chthonobacter albigriseus]|uniref:(5-formylfuran-3-yl)methyl phosphate synthase n=1 Tax=Chthonobacter albigriseus TaxID=1683161 RepID=UPI0015EF0637|nr:(5-formylfuran-3-yl)methyl phosphate synthase [Chthonobacter albigriseus]
MTALLVSVTSPEEAEVALANGAAYIDAKDPSAGALGALTPDTVAAIVRTVGDRATVTAAAGDSADLAVIEALVAAGAPIVKVAVPAGDAGAETLARIGGALGARTKLVAVFAADREPDLGLVGVARFSGFHGVMLDTAGKDAGLLQAMELADIAHFVAAARKNGLMVGLAGSLKVVDVGTLLPFLPDVVGFRGGVCENDVRTNPIDPAKVRAVATALAVHGARRAAGG